jgi:hypothetical protein
VPVHARRLGARELFNNSLCGATEFGPDLLPINPEEAPGVSSSAIELFLMDMNAAARKASDCPP